MDIQWVKKEVHGHSMSVYTGDGETYGAVMYDKAEGCWAALCLPFCHQGNRLGGTRGHKYRRDSEATAKQKVERYVIATVVKGGA